MKHHGIRPKVQFTEPSVTEPEHARSLDVKNILKKLANGQPVTLNQTSQNYGEDDLTQTKLDVLIKRQELVDYFNELTKQELTTQEVEVLKKLAPSLDLSKVKIKSAKQQLEKNAQTQTNEKLEKTNAETNNTKLDQSTKEQK